MRLKDLGEFRLIERISKRIRVDSSVIRGIGDDAAVIKSKEGFLLFTSDMLIEGVHFDLRNTSPYRIGYKALGVNISDIAAMGGLPRYALVSLGLPKGLDLKFVDGIYAGLKSMAKQFKINIVGGDTNSSKVVIIDIALIGKIDKNRLVLRSGAKVGDIILVTGRLGGSIKGRHLTFRPRLNESLFLVGNFKINSMVDISDGLSSDLIRICQASQVGSKIYESLIPLSKEADSIKNALHDGEDFELLFTVSKNIFKDLTRKFNQKFKTPLTAIGEVINKSAGIKLINRSGRVLPLKEGGFKHF